MISSPGVGSGLDVNAIVSQLMVLERRPLNRLETTKSDYEAQLSAYGKLKSALATFRSAMEDLDTLSDFKVYSATSSDEDVFAATAGSEAAQGTYSIQINNLAEAQKLGSAAFGDADTTAVGTSGDKMTITVGGQSFVVEVGGKTLNQLRDAINGAGDNVGVSASVIREDSSHYYLTLTADNTGTDNAMSLAFHSGSGGIVADPLAMSEINAAEDAELVVDGVYAITRATNTISDAIGGVTLNLNAEDVGNPHTLAINSDLGGVGERVQGFVDAYNDLKSTIDALRSNELEADTTLLTIERQMRSALNSAPSGLTSQYAYLAEVGVSFSKDGTLALDRNDLETALARDYNGTAELFAHNDQGYAYRLGTLVDDFLESDGLLNLRTDGIRGRIDTVEERISSLERRLEIVEQRYLSQFNALDTLIAELEATGNFLTQQLSSLSLQGEQ